MEIIVPRRPQAGMPGARFSLLALGLIAVAIGFIWMRDIEWTLLKWSLRSQFPEIQWITTGELAQRMQDRQSSGLLLLDVRTSAEWELSHIPGAQWIDPEARYEVALRDVPRESSIVTYCAVGFRSGQFATRLKAAGYANVRNLEGSIFQWANEHRPLIRGDESVTQVHPYNQFWGRLLAEEARAPLQ